MMKDLVLLFSLIAAATTSVVNGQNGSQSNAERFPGVDPDLIVNPPEGLDLDGCFKDLMDADIDGSGAIEKDEYLNFINVYGQRICWYQEELTLEQHGAFNSLACICRSQEGNDASCCLLDNAKLPNKNAINAVERTEEELLFMTVVCVVTDGTLQHLCTPYVVERSTPPPVIIVPVDTGLARSAVLEDGSIWALIMGIIGLLLLVCMCCCCCAAGTRTKSREEEEEDDEVKVIPPPVKEEPAPEQPRSMDMAPRDIEQEQVEEVQEEEEEQEEQEQEKVEEEEEEVIEEEQQEELQGGDEVEIEETVEEIEEETNANRGGAEAEDDDEGEGRRGRGSNYVDEDEEDPTRKWGGGRFPPEDPEPDSLKLKPIPPKDPEDPPEWDQPGREILEHKNKDIDEAQVFDPYVPDGGVNRPEREGKDPLDWRQNWNRPKPPEEDETDNRKHRIQSGLGEGEVWDKLDNHDDQSRSLVSGGGDVFDWVVQSALGVLDNADEQEDSLAGDHPNNASTGRP